MSKQALVGRERVCLEYGFHPDHGYIMSQEKEIRGNQQWHYDFVREIKNILRNEELSPQERRKEIEKGIEKLPPYDITKLSKEEQIFAFRDLIFIQNTLVNCCPREWNENKIPDQLADPIRKLSQALKIPAVGSYTTYVLSNVSNVDTILHRFFSAEKTYPKKILHTFTSGGSKNPEEQVKAAIERNKGHDPEKHFIRIHLALEKKGAFALLHIFDLMDLAPSEVAKGKELVLKKLENISSDLKEMRGMLAEMYSGTGVADFAKINSYLKGTKGMAGEAFEEDEKLQEWTEEGFDDDYAEGLYSDLGMFVSNHAGASGAQTPLFPTLDAFLRDPQSIPETTRKFVESQKEFFLKKHQDLILHVAEKSKKFRQIVSHDDKLLGAFNDCVEAMNGLREGHLKMIGHYMGDAAGTGETKPPAKLKPLEIDKLSKAKEVAISAL